ncbi:MAG: CHAD domain-containing protein [Bdellovibrionaceae bacterium]|nr:CHAD domain-containing protein [Pseudobdellovibrionaceae bacterium]
MKNKNLLSETLEKYWKNYANFVHSSREKISSKNIHKFRIATLKLEAVLGLVNTLKDIKHANRITDLLNKIRKNLGPLRDSQVESSLLDDIMDKKSKDKDSKSLIKFFNQDKQHAKKKAQKALENIQLKQEKSIVDEVSKAILEVEVAKNKKQIKNELDQKMKSSVLKYNFILSKIDPAQVKDIHNFRIFAKKLRYRAECLQSLEKKSRFSLKTLKKVQSVAGQIQDDTVLLKKLNQFRSLGKKNEHIHLEKTYNKIGNHRDKLIKKDFSQLQSLKWLN